MDLPSNTFSLECPDNNLELTDNFKHEEAIGGGDPFFASSLQRSNEKNKLEDSGNKSQGSEQQSQGLSSDNLKRVNNDTNAVSSQNNEGITDLHKYASLGDLKSFQTSFEALKKDNPNNYLKIVNKYNNHHETLLSLAIKNKQFDIALYLMNQLNDIEKNHQFELIHSISSEQIDDFLKYAKDKGFKEIVACLSHIASQLKYNRHGGDYQLKLLLLFAYKNYESNIKFRLGTEVHEADKFDDLVLRYREKGSNTYKYRFLQAKHSQHLESKNAIKQDDLLGITSNNDFDLGKYFNSYLKDREEFKDGDIEDMILCTNNLFAFNVEDFHLMKIREEEEKIKYKTFSNLGGKLYKFDSKFNGEKLKNILRDRIESLNKENNKVKDKKVTQITNFLDQLEKHFDCIDEFLSKLVLAVEQPSSILLSKKIRENMGSDTYNFVYYATFQAYINEWFAKRESDNTARFILSSEIKEFFDGLKNRIANMELNGLSSLFKKKIKKFTEQELEFKGDSEDVSEVEKFLNSNKGRILKLTYKEKDSYLSLAKIYQILNKKYQSTAEYTVSDLYSLTSLNFDILNQERVLNALKSEDKRLLVIECSFIDEDGKKLINKLYTEVLVDSVSSKKVILILNEELNNELDNILPDLSKTLSNTSIGMENNLDNFTLKSKNTILKTKITFFGYQRELTSLTTDASKEDLYLVIDGNALTTLIISDNNTIGSKHEYDFDVYIDIPRTFTYQTNIDKKCLKKNKNDLFAISGIEKSELSQLVPKNEKIREFADKSSELVRFIILNNHRDIRKDFNQLSSDHKKHTVHLLENKDSVLEWKQSHGSLFDLRRFVIMKGEHKKQIKDLTDLTIIAGEPGMGKSTILTTYSIKTRSLWPIRVNLKNYETHIYKANFADLDGIVKFLSSVVDPASSQSSLIKNLLQYGLKQQGQVTLLLDGYDEIKDCNQEKVVQLLKTLKTTQGKVLLTTRSHARSELEDALGTFAYSLNPFDGKEQKEFLKQFWIRKLNVKEPTQEKQINKFTKQLLDYFHKVNLMKKEGFVGIVLQARMVAEIFQDECKKYLKYETFNFFNFGIKNIFDLYERFIEYQYERYFKEKIEISIKLGAGSQNSLTKSYTKAYGHLALKSLFCEDQIQGLLRQERFSRQELQDIGLIKILKNDGTADFLHLTYTEYFAADLLVDALEKGEDHPKYRAVYNFLLMQIFRDNNKVIRDFVRNKTAKESNSNLNSKWKTIQKCDLFREFETIVKLQSEKSILDSDYLNTPDDIVFEKSLSMLQQDVERCMNWRNDGYYYNGDVELINKLFQKFLKEADIEALKITLQFLLKANRNSHFSKANAMFSFENNIGKAVIHYLTKVRIQGMFESVQDELRDNCIKAVVNEKVFSQFQERLNNLRDLYEENKREAHLKELTDFLIPKRIKTIEELKELNRLYYFLDIFYSTNIQDVKSFISSTEITQKEYVTRIIDSLKDINCGNNGVINRLLEHEWDLKSLRSFFIDILYHPSVITDTKSSINEIYMDKGLVWLERKGVLISRVLETLTPEMSKKFNSVLNAPIDGGTQIYSDGVFIDLINYIVNRIRMEKLPHIDKLAFLEMLVHFVNFSVKIDGKFPFTLEQLETTLKLVKDILNRQRRPTLAVSESTEYLCVLGKAGLKLIDAKKELLVLDPAGEFQYKLSSDHMNQIIELIKWKNKNSSKPRKEFLNRCYEIVELKKGDLKRKVSESDLQELKRLKVENCL